MLFPWIQLSLVFTLARAFSVSRHPTDWSGSPNTPTCEELQDFWNMMSQIIRMGPETNEIPVMPAKANAALDHILMDPFRKGKHSKLHRKHAKETFSNRLDSKDPFSKDHSWVVQSPVPPNTFVLPNSQTPSGHEENGIFGGFHEQLTDRSVSSNHHQTKAGSSSSVPLGDKKNVEREYYVPQWGSPEEVDTFGRFVDFDGGSPRFAINRTPKDTAGEWSDLPHGKTNQKLSQVICDDLMNSGCTVDEQCFCNGWKSLQCIHGKCSNYEQTSDMEGKQGTWHDGPIPQLQLRLLAMPAKKNYRTIFM